MLKTAIADLLKAVTILAARHVRDALNRTIERLEAGLDETGPKPDGITFGSVYGPVETGPGFGSVYGPPDVNLTPPG